MNLLYVAPPDGGLSTLSVLYREVDIGRVLPAVS